jgi:hypothetical protein
VDQVFNSEGEIKHSLELVEIFSSSLFSSITGDWAHPRKQKSKNRSVDFIPKD